LAREDEYERCQNNGNATPSIDALKKAIENHGGRVAAALHRTGQSLRLINPRNKNLFL
jgi:hypothetical protein